MHSKNTQEHYVVILKQRVLLIISCVVWGLTFIMRVSLPNVGSLTLTCLSFATFIISLFTVISYFIFMIEIKNGNVIYVNRWGKKYIFHMSDISDFKFNEKKNAVSIYLGNKKIAKITSGFTCYDFLVNDLKKYFIAEAQETV